MKRKLYILIIVLAIGFASVTTTLIIKGNTSISVNEADYDIYFSEAILDDVDKTNVVIDDTRQVINFDTNTLTLVGEKSILEYEVTNNSKQYDANVKINCMVKDQRIFDYVSLSYYIDKDVIPARTKANGNITVELIKAFTEDEEFNNSLTCEIVTSGMERDTLVSEEVEVRTYYTYGFLVNAENEPIKNAVVAVFDREEARYTTTDGRGMFIIDNLSSGEYNLYAIENMSVDEVKTKTQEEIESLANYQTSFHTKGSTVTFENNYLRYGKVVAGNPVTHDVTFDTNGSSIESFDSKIIEGQEVGFLPSVDHDSLIFEEWLGNGKTLTEDTIVDENTIILANYGEGVAKIGEKQFKTLNNAFQYVNTDDETTIEVIKDNSLTSSIETDKNIILNLNGKTVYFNDDFITNTGNLTIENGNIKSSGLNVLTNDGTMNLNNNLSIEHINKVNDSEDFEIIKNNEDKTLIIDNIYFSVDINDVPSKNVRAISNYGNATISNSNIQLITGQIFSLVNSQMTLINNDIYYSSTEATGRMLYIYGDCVIDGGMYAIKETNETSSGLLTILSPGNVTIKSGTFDNTYGKGISLYTYAGTTLTIGEANETVNIIGNNSNNYSLYNYGNLNIIDGTINATNTPGFILDDGTMMIGTETSTPTINSSEGCRLLTIKSNKDSSIKSANINELNSNTIYIYANAKLTIDNANIIQSNSTVTNMMFYVLGELVINDGTYKLSETNQTGNGLIQVISSGNVTINSGTFDNTYGKSNSIYVYSGAILNIGKDNKEINFFGNGTNNYTLNNIGVLNILEGKINVSNALYFIGDNGIMTLGTETTLPVIYGNDGCRLFEIRSNKGSTIVNADINVLNSNAIYMYANSKLTIDNANIIQSNSTATNMMFYVLGELVINDGTYKLSETNQTGNGLIQVNPSGNVTVNSGTFDNTYGKSNSISVYSGSTLNIGEENKETRIIGNASTSYTIASSGNLNILAGNIISENGYFIGSTGILTIGTTETTPTISGYGYNILSIRSNNDNKIINANIKAANAYAINVYADAKLTIDNANITQSNSTSTTRAINVSGELIINDGIFKMAEDNQNGYGLMNIQAMGTATINAGTFDNTYGISNSIYIFANSTFNMGSENKKVEIIGNTRSSYTIYSYGKINIPAGNILIERAPFIISAGDIMVGAENSKPTLESTTGGPILVLTGGMENKIINANMISNNMHAIYIYEGSKLTIDNINLEQTSSTNTNRAFIVNGELVINDGTFKMGSANQTGKGLIEVSSTGQLNINSGTFDNTYGKENTISTASGATFNIDTKDNEVNFIGNSSGSYDINNSGELNIISGKINATNGPFIITNGKTTLGTDSTTPTIEGAQGCSLFALSGGTESKVINANIIGFNSTLINIYEDAKLTIDNINLNQSNSTAYNRAISVNGELVINDGIFKIDESNVTSSGIISLSGNGNLTINSGIFDGTNLKGNIIFASSSTSINLGTSDKIIDFMSDGLYYAVSSAGTINIPDGNITSISGPLLISSGTLLVGSDETSPKIETDSVAFHINTGGESKIINANIKVSSGQGIAVTTGAKMTIDDCEIIQGSINDVEARLFHTNGELTINNGSYLSKTDNNKSYGLFSVSESGILNINGGTFEYVGEGNMIYTLEGSVVNIGKNEKNPISLISQTKTLDNYYFPMIANHGYINIYSGTLDANDSGVITQGIKDDDDGDTESTEEEKLNYSATTKIFGGSLINNEKTAPTISMSAGRLEMSGGEVVNKANGLTISNSGGTAIQTGGTSLNNSGVTVE